MSIQKVIASPHCWCGVRAYTRISQSEKNPDRPFYTCPYGRCKYFQWVTSDEEYNKHKNTNIPSPNHKRKNMNLTQEELLNTLCSFVNGQFTNNKQPPLKKRKYDDHQIFEQMNVETKLQTSILKEIRDYLQAMLSLVYKDIDIDDKVIDDKDIDDKEVDNKDDTDKIKNNVNMMESKKVKIKSEPSSKSDDDESLLLDALLDED